MQWYFCFNDRVSDYFEDMIKACVISARQNTTLSMNCLYDGKENLLTRWLQAAGVNVINTEIYFAGDLASADTLLKNGGNGYDPHAARGFYLPMQIPRAAPDQEFVLFTDVDVVFLSDVKLDNCRPSILAACGEVADMQSFSRSSVTTHFNSGVMVLNLPELRRRENEVLAVLRGGNFFRDPRNPGSTYDQWALNEAFGTEWQRLEDKYNWRAYWGADNQAAIVHFHGPKPAQIYNYIAGSPSHLDRLALHMLSQFGPQYAASLARYSEFKEAK